MLINLSISLVVALFLVPSLMSLIYKPRLQSASLIRRRKRIVKFTGWYGRYIAFGQRYRWAFVLLAVLMFGLPVWLIPEKMKGESRIAGRQCQPCMRSQCDALVVGVEFTRKLPGPGGRARNRIGEPANACVHVIETKQTTGIEIHPKSGFGFFVVARFLDALWQSVEFADTPNDTRFA